MREVVCEGLKKIHNDDSHRYHNDLQLNLTEHIALHV
jgi:hypothetical protein